MSSFAKASARILLAALLALCFPLAGVAAGQQAADGHAAHDHANQAAATLPSLDGDDAHVQHEQQADDHAAHEHANHGAGSDADDPHAQHSQAAAAGGSKLARVEVPAGLALVDQHGEPVDLRRDVIGERIAVVNFVYTSCTTVCPVTSTIFSMLQKNLGDRLGSEVVLITLTVDPARDTPHRLRTYAKNFGPGESWRWLTGDNGTVERALRAFGAYTANFEDHPALVLVGDADNATWYRLYGFPAPEAIEEKITELLNNRNS